MAHAGRRVGRGVLRDPAAGRLRALAAQPLTRVIVAAVVTGLLCATTVWSLAPALGHTSAPLVLGWLHGRPAVVVLVTLTCLAELVAVRLHREDTVEELTLLDAMVLLNVLLLPPRQALLVTLVGILTAYVVRRRSPVKALFNLGTYATGASVLVVLVHAVTGGVAGLDGRLLAAVVVGTAGFVAVNVLSISLVLSAVTGARLLDLVRQDVRLSLLTVGGTAALAATAAALAVHTPALLPCTVLPAAAMTHAYRSTAIETEERRRSASVLHFSAVLASSPGREEAVTAFLVAAREGFHADEVLVVDETGDALALSAQDDSPRRVPAPAHLELLRLAAQGGVLLSSGLPRDWAEAMLAPIEDDGRRTGAVVVVSRRRRHLARRHLTILTPLSSALGVALKSAEHLRQRSEETSKLRAVVDQSSDGILVLDGTGTVQVWSPALERLSGVTSAQALGRPLGAVLQGRGADGGPVDAFAVGRSELSPAQPHATVELDLVRPDGEPRSVRCAHAGVFAEAVLVRDVVIVHDLTKQRQVERLKSDFVATVSHELRTPVTPIKGYADLLRTRGDAIPVEKRTQMLDVIADRAAHLARLVEDLLLASKISAEREPERSVVIGTGDLVALAARAIEDFAPSAARLVLHRPPEPVPVCCDPVRTVQILTNIVSNALKYSPEGTRVDVSVGSRDGTGFVSVRDQGRGLPSDQLERVFDKFHRVEDPLVMTTSGTGLGLFIARHLARAMGGDVSVASALGEGADFVVRLPLAPPAESAVATAPPRAARARAARPATGAGALR